MPKSMGIDTWAVDYVLLDGENRILGNTYGYRDGRTKGMDKEVYRIIPEDALYARTGIQKQIFNTIYQLMAVKQQEPENMEKAEWLLMLPDYFHFLLTGNKMSEYTNATSTQLVSPETRQWDCELIERLGYKLDIPSASYARNGSGAFFQRSGGRSGLFLRGGNACYARYGIRGHFRADAYGGLPLHKFRDMVPDGN